MGIDEIRMSNVQRAEGQYDNPPAEVAENGQQSVTVIQVRVQNNGMGTEVQRQSVNPFDGGVDDAPLQKSLGKSTGLVASANLADTLETLSNKYTEIQTKLNRLRRDMSKSPDVRFMAEECLADLGAIDFKTGYPTPAQKGNKNVKLMAFNSEVRNYEQKCLAKMNELIATYDLETVLAEMKAQTGQVIGTTVGMGEAIMANDNANAGMVMANDNANTGTVLAQGAETQHAVHQEGQATRRAVHAEGQATRNAVHAEGAMTRNEVRFQGAMTRNTVREEGAATRNLMREESVQTRNTVQNEGTETRSTVRETAHDTQVLGELSDQLNLLLDKVQQKSAKAGISSVRDKIVSSGLPQAKKEELLRDLAGFVEDQSYISTDDIADRNKIVTKAIQDDNNSGTTTPSAPVEQPIHEIPSHEEPIFEDPFPNAPHGEPTTSVPNDAAEKPKDAGSTKEADKPKVAGPTKEKVPVKAPDTPLPDKIKEPEKVDKKKGKKNKPSITDILNDFDSTSAKEIKNKHFRKK